MRRIRSASELLFGFIILLVVFMPLDSAGLCPAPDEEPGEIETHCDFSRDPRIIWFGTQHTMTIQEIASYCAPVFWFSPDEPTLYDAEGKDIRIPDPLPFEEDLDSPVVYYQYNRILSWEGAEGQPYIEDPNDKSRSIIDMRYAVVANLKFIAYFHKEEGFGGHPHDVEPTEFKILIGRSNDDYIKEHHPEIQCDEVVYYILIAQVIAEAHGLQWYFNTLDVDDYTKFPMHLLVEEGKHAMCTDKNSDGYYTPTYDVNRYVNDAWGCRDIIRSGALFTGSYQAWMTKVRRDEHRVFPPLPEDSYLRKKLSVDGVYAPDNAVYELRPFPSSELAEDDALLKHKMEEKEAPGWPEVKENTSLKKLDDLVGEGRVIKSLSLSIMYDGDLGFSFAFPLFIIKNFEDPMAGGFVVHRMYFKDKKLQDFGWMLLYTPSASRWVDGYFACGVDWDTEEVSEGVFDTDTEFVVESGIKFRVNMTKTPLKFMSFLWEFGGLRIGVKNKGAFEIESLQYVVEFGGGIW